MSLPANIAVGGGSMRSRSVAFEDRGKTTWISRWQKTFVLHENWHAEFRADAFNTFNHTQWNGAQTTYPYATVGNYGNVPFGQATGAREARIMQVALKLAF
jgi:hypothetical protein